MKSENLRKKEKQIGCTSEPTAHWPIDIYYLKAEVPRRWKDGNNLKKTRSFETQLDPQVVELRLGTQGSPSATASSPGIITLCSTSSSGISAIIESSKSGIGMLVLGKYGMTRNAANLVKEIVPSNSARI